MFGFWKTWKALHARGIMGMICLAYVTGPAPMNTPEVAKAPAKIEYQPLPETALGGGSKPAQAAPDPCPSGPGSRAPLQLQLRRKCCRQP